MRKSRSSEGQIIAILKEGEAGTRTCDLFRKHGIIAQTFYCWRSRYSGVEVNEARHLKVPVRSEHGNHRLMSRIASG